MYTWKDERTLGPVDRLGHSQKEPAVGPSEKPQVEPGGEWAQQLHRVLDQCGRRALPVL